MTAPTTLTGLAAALLLTLPAATAAAATLVVGVDAPTPQAVVDMAASGDLIEVPDGVWPGPVVIRTARLHLIGTGGTIDGGTRGTVIRVDAADVVVQGLKVVRSGDDLTSPDTCIWLTKAALRVVVRSNELSECLFGIWSNEVVGGRIEDNHVQGATTGHRSFRGNGIHLFDSEELEVVNNRITGGRDGIYVSATENSRILANTMSGTRYGIHYMYSYDNEISDNVAHHNGSGIALMGSLRLKVHGNVATENDERGILFRDVQYCHIAHNRVENNTEGLFFYSSTENEIVDNRIAFNLVGVKIWAGSRRNVVTGNTFIANRRQVFFVSSSDLVWGVEHPGNVWGDYLGWDQDGDGLGDRPYRVDSFTANLVHRYPASVLLMRSPALELLTHLHDKMPLLEVPTVIDQRPMMRAARVGDAP